MKTPTRLDIQGMRAVAVVLVILFHLPTALSLRGGFVGVDMFYVISGFVVTNMVIGSNEAGGALRSIVSFLRRRVMRLVPALSVVVIVTLLVSVLVAPSRELASVAKAGLAGEFFASNFYFVRNFDTYWSPEVLRSPFLHTWSLGVEFQVYLIFPLVFLGVFLAGRATRAALSAALLVTSVLAVISFLLFAWLLIGASAPIAGFDPRALAFYTPVSRFWEFALGILPALLARRGLPFRRVPASVFVAAGWLLTVAGVVLSTAADTLNFAVVAACSGVAALIVAGIRQNPIRSVLAWRPLVWIGDRSYSIYLWHWPLLVFSLWLFPGNLIVAVGSVAVTVALSMLTFRFVEQRFRRSSTPRRALVPSAAFVASGAVVALSAIVIASAGWYLTPIPLSSVARPFADDGVRGSDVVNSLSGCTTEALRITCVNRVGAPTVVVIGDSLGYRSMPAVQLAAQEHGLNATMLWTGGCGIELASCPDFVYDYLVHTDVAALLISMNFDRASNRLNVTEAAAGDSAECPADTDVTSCAAHTEAVERFISAARPGLTDLERYTDHILMALPFPQQTQFVDACLSPPLAQRILGLQTVPALCAGTSQDWQVARQGGFPEAIRSVVEGDGPSPCGTRRTICARMDGVRR